MSEVVAQLPEPELPETLPILGLSDVVIFPGMVVPLLVESDESTKLIDDVVEGDRLLGLVLQRKADVQNPTPDDLFEHGCGARERQAKEVHGFSPGRLGHDERPWQVAKEPMRSPQRRGERGEPRRNARSSLRPSASSAPR